MWCLESEICVRVPVIAPEVIPADSPEHAIARIADSDGFSRIGGSHADLRGGHIGTSAPHPTLRSSGGVAFQRPRPATGIVAEHPSRLTPVSPMIGEVSRGHRSRPGAERHGRAPVRSLLTATATARETTGLTALAIIWYRFARAVPSGNRTSSENPMIAMTSLTETTRSR